MIQKYSKTCPFCNPLPAKEFNKMLGFISIKEYRAAKIRINRLLKEANRWYNLCVKQAKQIEKLKKRLGERQLADAKKADEIISIENRKMGERLAEKDKEIEKQKDCLTQHWNREVSALEKRIFKLEAMKKAIEILKLSKSQKESIHNVCNKVLKSYEKDKEIEKLLKTADNEPESNGYGTALMDLKKRLKQ